MALDVYLQIDGIKGDSIDSALAGWIELTSATWGVKQKALPHGPAAARQPSVASIRRWR